MREEAVLIGDQQMLSGVLTEPDHPRQGAPAVLLLNAGRIHRVGPNRLYVKLARALAAQGFVVLRFDFSGIGESDVRGTDSPVAERVLVETVAAMDAVTERCGIDRFALAGLCSGAVISFAVATIDTRVVDVVMVNARVNQLNLVQRARAKLRKVRRHYWKIALLRPRKSVRAMRAAAGRVVMPPDELGRARDSAEARAKRLHDLIKRGVGLLMIYSESDIGLDQAHVALGRALRRAVASGGVRLDVVPGTDHVFTLLDSQQRLLALVSSWFGRRYPAAAPLEAHGPVAAPDVADRMTANMERASVPRR